MNKAEGHCESRNEAAGLQAPAKDQTLAKAIDLRDQIKRLLTADFMAFNELPESREEIARLRWAIDATLYQDFWGQLSEAERSFCKTDYIPRSLHDEWDRHIVEAAQQYDSERQEGFRFLHEVRFFPIGFVQVQRHGFDRKKNIPEIMRFRIQYKGKTLIIQKIVVQSK